MQKIRFALFGNTYQAHKSAHVARLLEILRKRNARFALTTNSMNFLS